MKWVTVSSKVNNTEYDAYTALIEEKFKRFEERLARHEAQVKSMICGALVKGLAWITTLIFGFFGALWALVSRMK